MEEGKKMPESIMNKEPGIIVPVIEEQVTVGTKIVETGRVQISTHITEHDETINIPLLHEEHLVQHVPINVFVDEIPSVREQEGILIIPVWKEVIVKRTLLVEEIRITKKTVETNRQQAITLKKQEVIINHLPLNRDEI